ncbi:MAG: hypothetical protein IT324_00100 [Anaerolineae bacterium]|nr:hypothetical protein [Anaerolineae bacterium]
MATLHGTRQPSSLTVKHRLKQVCQERSKLHNLPEPAGIENVTETLPSGGAASASPETSRPNPYTDRLSDLEQRHLLLQTVAIYPGWHLVSVQNRPETGLLIAYLVRNHDAGDPTRAIREGRAMQIMMDALGDMKVQRPRRKVNYRWLRWLQKLAVPFSA